MPKKIITAIGHPGINGSLREMPDFEVEYEDILYQEGLLEILKASLPDVLLLSELLPGGYDKKGIIEKIREIDGYFKVIIILEREDVEFRNFLISKGIFDIFVDNQAEMDDLVECINQDPKVIVRIKQEIPKETREEMENLKRLLLEKPAVIREEVVIPQIQRQEVIAVCGPGSAGKSCFVTQLAVLLTQRSKAKILVMDFDTVHPSLDQYLGVPKSPPNVDYSIGGGRCSGLNYMIDAIDKNKLESSVFDELVARPRGMETLHVLTGNDSLYVCQDVLNSDYYRVILEKAKELYDIILIDTSSNIFVDSTQFAAVNASRIFLLAEGTYLSLKRTMLLLEMYVKEWNVRKEKIRVVINKYNSYSLDKAVVGELLGDYSICGYIRQDSRYDLYLNKNVPMMKKALRRDREPFLRILEEFSLVPRRRWFERILKPADERLEEMRIRHTEEKARTNYVD